MSKNVLAIAIILVCVFVVGALTLGRFKPNGSTPQSVTTSSNINTPQDDKAVIRTFMDQPNLELTLVGTDLPMPYFRVGKVTKVGTGENMDKVDGWVRQVNIYDQKDLINGQCNVYEYHTDLRNHNLTAVIIRGLRQNEIEALKNNGTTCSSNSVAMPKITKSEAETIAFDYLKRVISNLDQMKDQFAYSLQSNDESHQWLWEDKSYKLPEGLASRPYYYPIIRISVNGDKTISYWNTVSLFQSQ